MSGIVRNVRNVEDHRGFTGVSTLFGTDKTVKNGVKLMKTRV